MRRCKVCGWEYPSRLGGRGYCGRCYMRARQRGWPEHLPNPDEITCKVPSCKVLTARGGLCRRHRLASQRLQMRAKRLAAGKVLAFSPPQVQYREDHEQEAEFDIIKLGYDNLHYHLT